MARLRIELQLRPFRTALEHQDDARLLASCAVGNSESSEKHRVRFRSTEPGDLNLTPILSGDALFEESQDIVKQIHERLGQWRGHVDVPKQARSHSQQMGEGARRVIDVQYSAGHGEHDHACIGGGGRSGLNGKLWLAPEHKSSNSLLRIRCGITRGHRNWIPCSNRRRV